jgi:hypothetical protein
VHLHGRLKGAHLQLHTRLEHRRDTITITITITVSITVTVTVTITITVTTVFYNSD